MLGLTKDRYPNWYLLKSSFVNQVVNYFDSRCQDINDDYWIVKNKKKEWGVNSVSIGNRAGWKSKKFDFL